RRRCDRRARKYFAPHRKRYGTDGGGGAGRARSQLHSDFDEPVTGGSVYSAAADGRTGGTPVSRVRGDTVGGDHGVAGDFADDDADVVRALAERGVKSRARPSASNQRPLFQCAAGIL